MKKTDDIHTHTTKSVQARDLVPDEAVKKLLKAWDETIRSPGDQKRVTLGTLHHPSGTIHPRIHALLKKYARLYGPNVS